MKSIYRKIPNISPGLIEVRKHFLVGQCWGGFYTEGLIFGRTIFCTVLQFALLYCNLLHCIVLCCTVLQCSVLYCDLLYCTAAISFVLLYSSFANNISYNLQFISTFLTCVISYSIALNFQVHLRI